MRGLDAFAKAHPKEADRMVPIFISIDPARDTPRSWANCRRLLAAPGRPDRHSGADRQAAKEFAVYYARGKETRAAI
jgi:protein SCO1/2